MCMACAGYSSDRRSPGIRYYGMWHAVRSQGLLTHTCWLLIGKVLLLLKKGVDARAHPGLPLSLLCSRVRFGGV